MKNRELRNIIFTGLLVTMGIVLSYVLTISYPPNSTIIKFGIGFVPLIIISCVLGPKYGFLAAIAQDLIGYFTFGVQTGPFYLGFTLNSVLYGVIPGLIYNLKLKDINIFKYINIAFLIVLIGLGVYVAFDMETIITSIEARLGEEMVFNPIVLYLMFILGELGLIGTLVYVFLNRKQDDRAHRIIFSVIILHILTALILTPIWVMNLYGIPYLGQLPLRIVKTPFEIIIYIFLLVKLTQILKDNIFAK
jgi:ECF transporter S component (folate family)